jgi:hypothetical protein
MNGPMSRWTGCWPRWWPISEAVVRHVSLLAADGGALRVELRWGAFTRESTAQGRV